MALFFQDLQKKYLKIEILKLVIDNIEKIFF